MRRLTIVKILGATTITMIAGTTVVMAADVYKWVDEDGTVHFGDRPSATNDSERMEVHAPGPAEDPDAASRAAQRDKMLKVWQEERSERKEQAAQALAEKKERERRCAEAKKRLFEYEHASYLYDLDEQGNRQVLSDEDHKQALQEARDLVAEWCS
jgi:hypothetical protein